MKMPYGEIKKLHVLNCQSFPQNLPLNLGTLCHRSARQGATARAAWEQMSAATRATDTHVLCCKMCTSPTQGDRSVPSLSFSLRGNCPPAALPGCNPIQDIVVLNSPGLKKKKKSLYTHINFHLCLYIGNIGKRSQSSATTVKASPNFPS